MATQAMSDLSLDSRTVARAGKAKKAAPVADSWEDEDVDSDQEPETLTPTIAKSPDSDAIDSTGPGSGFAAPPPTPSSPSYAAASSPPWQSMGGIGGYGSGTVQPPASSGSSEPRRPEKTDAVARRMIASALGVRTLRPTEEQRAYDRAVREKERKKREEEREAENKRKEEAEKAKAAIWED
ncbi:hypothetical protein F4819DRAFT_451279 [Hypoxylon fuscum]|nr:hypothetical protein F4819DRAFT_451279 [Hypoxylon fuscum]